MADYAPRGLALTEYSKSVPPGWEPHNPSYTLRQYNERWELWGYYNNTPGSELTSNQIGPAIVGRLKGSAYRLANKIQIEIPNDPRSGPAYSGRTLTGAEAICFPGLPAQDHVVPPIEAIPSGVKSIRKYWKMPMVRIHRINWE